MVAPRASSGIMIRAISRHCYDGDFTRKGGKSDTRTKIISDLLYTVLFVVGVKRKVVLARAQINIIIQVHYISFHSSHRDRSRILL